MLGAPWVGFVVDRPCLFPPERARENAHVLRSVLGSGWLDSEPDPPSHPDRHPILTNWRSPFAPAFLALNALAESFRRLEALPNFETVVFDLKQPRLYESALHVLRCADLVARADGASVVRFFPQDQESVPDFAVAYHGQEYLAEAKLLTSSDVEKAFVRWAEPIRDQLLTRGRGLLAEPYWLRIVLENAIDLPEAQDVISVAESLGRPPLGLTTLRRWQGHRFLLGMANYPDNLPNGMRVAPAPIVSLLAPRSREESLRVFDRCKRASRQLRSIAAVGRSGLLFLGGDVFAHRRFLAELMERRLSDGKYSGIGAAFLYCWWHVADAEGYTVIERFSVSAAPGPANEFVSGVQWNGLGLLEGLLPAPDYVEPEIPAYACSGCQGPLRAGANEVLWHPDLKGIPRAWLGN